MKILVVDDMPSMRQVILHMLRGLGHSSLDEATNGVEALKKLRAQNYDLLITDLHMPNLDGKQLLEKVRSDKRLADLPVLMVSCEDDKKQITELIKAKVTGFIVKPFNTDILRKHIDWIKEDIQIV
jgi:two-component system, chemotaxis family, chemotaxis protein CheY